MGFQGLLAGAAVVVGVVIAASPSVAAESVADFYRGKQIRLVIGQPAGGAIDLLTRTVARHMTKHIPGNPQIVAQNMEGAGSRVAANWLYNVAPKDGTVLG